MHQRADEVGIEQRGLVGIGARQNAGDDRIERVEHRRRRARAAPPNASRRRPAASPPARRRSRRRSPSSAASPPIRPASARTASRRRTASRTGSPAPRRAADSATRRNCSSVEPSSSIERPICSAGRVVRIRPGPRPRIGHDEREQERAGVARPHHLQRVHVRLRYFAVVSSRRSTPPRRTSARCRSGAGGARAMRRRAWWRIDSIGIDRMIATTIGNSKEKTQCGLSAGPSRLRQC